jgi:hypothetical protein
MFNILNFSKHHWTTSLYFKWNYIWKKNKIQDPSQAYDAT